MSFEMDIIGEKQTLAAFISKLPEAIIICDAKGNILLHNSQSENYLKSVDSPKAIISQMDGKNIASFIDPGLIEHALDEINDQLKQQANRTGSTFVIHQTNRILHAQIVPILGGAGQYKGCVMIIDDITRQARAEKGIDAFLKILSKNARSPLASIRAAIEAMRSFPQMESDRQEQFKEIIYNESVVLSELLEGASEEYAGLNRVKKNVKPLAVDRLFRTIRRRVGEQYEILCHIAGQSSEESSTIMAEPFQLISAFVFLLVQLKRETGCKEFTLSRTEKNAIVFADICWPGKGISPDILKCWESQDLFPQSPGSHTTVSQVLSQHQSTIWVYENHDALSGMAYLRWFFPVIGKSVEPSSESAPILQKSRMQISDIALFDQSDQTRQLDDRLLTELSYTSLIREINHATQIEQVMGKHSQLPRLIHNMLTSGTTIRTVTWLVTAFSDAILQKLLAFALADLGEPPVPFAFVALGSEGRKEQTLKTDQDNAIIFQDPGTDQPIETIQQYFLTLGSKVCTWLDQAGFDFCKGGIMAKNPKWCQPLSLWKNTFCSWIHEASPENLMHTSIFFDFRFAHGKESLVRSLSQYLEKNLKDQSVFFRTMVENAIRFRPPIGLFSRLLTESKGPYKNYLDIKKANQPIVDFAKIYSLKHRIRETSTLDRLYQLYARRVLTREAYNEMEQAYSFNMQLRFMGQINAVLEQHIKPDNYINPRELSSIQRKMLKEVLKRIKQIQARMEKEFIRE